VADDDEAVRYVIGVALKREGFEVLTARDGFECISVASSGAPEAILLDLRMPLADGFEVLRRRNEWDPVRRVPVFVISGSEEYDRQASAALADVAGVFQKPFDLVALVSAVKSAVERARSGGLGVSPAEGGGDP
jgi:CheY-like chemotaxis protein